MGSTPLAAGRIDPAWLDAVRERYGLGDVPAAVVLRFAVARAAGHRHPERVATVRPGPKPGTKPGGRARA